MLLTTGILLGLNNHFIFMCTWLCSAQLPYIRIYKNLLKYRNTTGLK